MFNGKEEKVISIQFTKNHISCKDRNCCGSESYGSSGSSTTNVEDLRTYRLKCSTTTREVSNCSNNICWKINEHLTGCRVVGKRYSSTSSDGYKSSGCSTSTNGDRGVTDSNNGTLVIVPPAEVMLTELAVETLVRSVT